MKFFGLTIKREKAMQRVDTSGNGWWGIIREAFAGAWQKGIVHKTEDLLASPIVFSCITLISSDIGKLRFKLVKSEKGIWVDGNSKSPYWSVLRKPNRFQNHIQFKEWWIMSKLRHGNTYGLKERDARGIVVAIYVLDACRVTPLVSDDGSVFYEIKKDNLAGVQEESVTVPASEIIHDRMNCLYHPLVGIAPMYAAAIAAGIGIDIQRNVARFFQNGSNPGGILIAPGAISLDNAQALKEQWQTNYSGENSGKVAVIGDGMKFEQMTTNAVDAQLIETMKWSDERVCSVFHMPAYKVGVGAVPTLNNIEAQQQDYYAGCLQSLIEQMECCLDEGIGLDGVKDGVELDLEGLMRMDSKTQMETLKNGVQGSILAINDGRKKLNLPPLTGGDTVYMQQQDFPLDQVRDNKISSTAAPTDQAPQPMSEEDQAAVAEAKAIIETQKAIDAMRQAVTSEALNV